MGGGGPGAPRTRPRWAASQRRVAHLGDAQRVQERPVIDVVWFKRDLRIRDHAPIAGAAADSAPGGVVYLYVYEPELLHHPTHHPAHLRVVNEALAELRGDLRERGAELTLRVGSMPHILTLVQAEVGAIRTLRSHQETGHGVSYARDRRVRAWCEAHGVAWVESVQDGVQRGLRDRVGWAARWARAMDAPEVAVPARLPFNPDVDSGPLLSVVELGLQDVSMPDALAGGRRAAESRLASFLESRGHDYTAAMASPVAGWEACSRVSADLAVGTLSLRVARQAAVARTREVAGDALWSRSLRSFERRLAWRSHFMQKLESEPAIEYRATNRALDDLRADGWDEAGFVAWRDGRTGYPLIDAGMRALAAGGWVNFRLRATLVSFATYHLWLDWRPVATELARRFLDFEPGIHYPQVHMQAGVTGVNTIRIYNPWKQASDVDPDGVFVRRWLPELAHVPAPWHLCPHEAPPLVRMMIGDYPPPIVDHLSAYRAARDRVYAAKRRPEVRREAARVLARHVAGGGRGRR